MQAIWSHQSDDLPVSNRPVNYDRLRKSQGYQRQNRRQNNDHYGDFNQNQNYGQNFNNCKQNHGNFGHNFNNRNWYSSGNYEYNNDNRGQLFNNGYSNRHNLAHAEEVPSRQTNNASSISQQGNFVPPSR